MFDIRLSNKMYESIPVMQTQLQSYFDRENMKKVTVKIYSVYEGSDRAVESYSYPCVLFYLGVYRISQQK